ncbi:MAG: hypothetical protein IT293_02535 [Deltaproteobacteria bacterium]|nr:hypothetical protein [Deltaproteobacteria bacterium]
MALDKLAAHPHLRAECLTLVEAWIARPDQAHARPWLDEWKRMLADWSIDRIRDVVLDPEGGQTLRRCSPLAPVLSPRERWAAFDEVNADIVRTRDDDTSCGHSKSTSLPSSIRSGKRSSKARLAS